MHGLLPFNRYFQFSGRAGRAEFWQFTGLAVAIIAVAAMLDGGFNEPDVPVLTLLVSLGLIIPWAAAGVRRLHDRDITGKLLGTYLALGGVSWLILTLNNPYDASKGAELVRTIGEVLQWLVRGMGLLALFHMVQSGDEHANSYGAPPVYDEGEVLHAVASVQSATFAESALVERPIEAAPVVDPLDQIERLAKLRDAGTLTDDEFQKQKAVYLSKLQG